MDYLSRALDQVSSIPGPIKTYASGIAGVVTGGIGLLAAKGLFSTVFGKFETAEKAHGLAANAQCSAIVATVFIPGVLHVYDFAKKYLPDSASNFANNFIAPVQQYQSYIATAGIVLALPSALSLGSQLLSKGTGMFLGSKGQKGLKYKEQKGGEQGEISLKEEGNENPQRLNSHTTGGSSGGLKSDEASKGLFAGLAKTQIGQTYLEGGSLAAAKYVAVTALSLSVSILSNDYRVTTAVICLARPVFALLSRQSI